MAILASTYDEFLKNYGPVIREELVGTYDRFPSEVANLFSVESSDSFQEKVHGATGLGLMSVFNGSLNYQQPEPLWPKTREHTEFAEGTTIERKLIDDLAVPEALRRVRNLGDLAAESVENYASAYYNSLNDTTFTYNGTSFDALGPDAKAICASDHPYSPTDSGTQSNIGTNVFSADNVTNAKNAMRTFLDHKRQKKQIMPDTLVIGPYLEDAAYKMFPAAQTPGNANNDSNPLNPAAPMNHWNRGLKIVVWNYLDGTSASNSPWFLIDSRLMRQSNFWFWRVNPEFNQTDDFDSFQIKYSAYARWSVLTSDWRWIYGNFPT